MLLGGSNDISDVIVRLFASAGRTSVAALHKELRRRGLTCSMAGVYKATQKLAANGVLIRTRGEYSLALPWLLDLQSFTENCLARQGTVLAGLTEGQETSIWFGNLFALNDAYSHAITAAVREVKPATIYSWNPHPWFHLAQPKHEDRYLETLRRLGVRMLKAVGGSYPLDRVIGKTWPTEIITAVFADSNWNFSRTEYFVACPPLILSIHLPRGSAAAIDSLFETTRRPDQLDLGALRRVFLGSRARYLLRIKRDSKRCHSIVRRFSPMINL